MHVTATSRPVASGARLLLAVALVLALAAAAAPTAQAQGTAPDRVDPPAAGEGPYPDDPSEPDEASARSFAAQPSPRYSASGVRLPAQQLHPVADGNRFLTAVAASRDGWPDGAPAAVLATGEAHADALAGASLAGAVGGPLLLTHDADLASEVGAELRRLQPARVYVLGRLAPEVEAQVEALGLTAERVGDDDPHRTSSAVARRAVELGADASTILVASSRDFPDALAASALAAGRKLPILLVPAAGSAEWLRDRVEEIGAQRVWVIGGPDAVSEETVAGLPGLERIAGPERTATAAAVADRARDLGLTGPPVLASAEAFPDGLSGGVLAGVSRRGPVVLTWPRELSEVPARWLAASGTTRLDVMGGSAAIAPLARCQARAGDTRALLCVEEELRRQGMHVGTVDGRLDHQSVWSFYAFQKVAGLQPTGDFGEAEYRRLLVRPRLTPRMPELGADHVEIDLGRQLVLVVRDGEVRHVLHTSTGKPSTPTIRGAFTVYETRDYRQANRMYRPAFFHGGYAFHGYPEIPLHPASAGCARLFDGDMDLLWPFVQVGARVGSYG